MLHLRHTLVLIDRFRLLCVLRSDAGDLADVLQLLIATWCEGFKIFDALHSLESGIEPSRFGRDRAECLQELEMLLLGFRQRAPAAVRGVEHALDTLVVQCVLCEAIAKVGSA